MPSPERAPELAWLELLEASCLSIEVAVQSAPDQDAALDAPVPTCPGWHVADVLVHLSTIHRLVIAWLDDGRRPRTAPPAPEAGSALGTFKSSWRELHARLSGLAPRCLVATFSPWDDTAGFWHRRQTHEHTIHALDVALALGREWRVSEALALDGIDEFLRLWMASRLGTEIGGDGSLVLIDAGERAWTIAMHARLVEVNGTQVSSPTTPASVPDATLSGSPQALYRELWGRSDPSVRREGEAAALEHFGRLVRRACA